MRTFLFSLWTTTFTIVTAMTSPMKRILVTGGNKGIGKAICARLLSEWNNTFVILSARDETRGLQAVQDLIRELGDDSSRDRIEFLLMDTSCDESVQAAVRTFQSGPSPELYAIINNAGVMGQGTLTMQEVVNTNYFGPRRVNDAFGKHLQRPGGRIVNIASAAGPSYVASLPKGDLKTMLSKPWTIPGGVSQLDEIAKTIKGKDPYGASKALLNAYTALHARQEPHLIINSVTPGWIQTDMTQGSGASNPPSRGAIPPCWLAMDNALTREPTGRYYGSDCVRSPLHVYRGPGDAPYVNDEDVVGTTTTSMGQS